MEILGIDHIGIVTKDLDASSSFYKNFLGFTLGEMKDIREMQMKILMMQKGNECIELLEPDNKDSGGFGLKHYAFLCKNIDDVHAYARKNDYRLLHKTPIEFGDLKFFFLNGPDGELIEFMEKKQEVQL